MTEKRIRKKTGKKTSKKTGRPKIPFVQRYCLNCGKPIPKKTSILFYYVLEYCCVACKKEHMLIEKTCGICGEQFKVLPVDANQTRCNTCKEHIRNGAKPCAHCNKLMFYYTPLLFGRKEYCSIDCMKKDMGANIRYCVNCKLPIVCSNGSINYYHNRTKHKNCQLFQTQLQNTKIWTRRNIYK